MIYIISSVTTDQILKTGKIRPTISYRSGMEIKSINPKVSYRKIQEVSETFNIPVRDLEMRFIEKGA